ncbi:MAG: radical SAM protein [Polyangiaceae bacterium]|nr:radical SAM protein [Polyangiaceae bacterium]
MADASEQRFRLPIAGERPRDAGAQYEIQLSHLCNNRCVFCVSGRNTHHKIAPIVPLDEVLGPLRSAREKGYQKVTVLGGEPTILPYFLDVVREAVALGFSEIVLFSNGARLHRPELLDAVLATGGNFEFRFSFQGATRESHERTTKRKGSWDQLLASVDAARARGQRVTANMCVVATNYEDVPRFAELLVPRGVSQLHLDMMNPYDAGISDVAELHAVQARYSLMAPRLAAMIAAFPPGFDVHVGNLPFCVAPALAASVHHAGQPTETATVNGAQLDTKDKYDDKTSQRRKAPGCATCVFDHACTGFFGAYLEQHGDAERRPVDAAALAEVDPERRLFSLHVRAEVRRALDAIGAKARLRDTREHDLDVELDGGVALQIGRPRAPGAHAATDRVSLTLRAGGARGVEQMSALFDALVAGGHAPVHAPGADAVVGLRPSVARRLGRLRAAAPFAGASWSRTRPVTDGVEVLLASGDGGRAALWLTEERGLPRGGYRVDGDATPGLVDGLRAALRAIGR